MREFKIDGLENVQELNRFPEEALRLRQRQTEYGRLLEAATKKVYKLAFKEEKRAKNVYLALRQKLNDKRNVKLKAQLTVGKLGNTVFIGPRRLLPQSKG